MQGGEYVGEAFSFDPFLTYGDCKKAGCTTPSVAFMRETRCSKSKSVLGWTRSCIVPVNEERAIELDELDELVAVAVDESMNIDEELSHRKAIEREGSRCRTDPGGFDDTTSGRRWRWGQLVSLVLDHLHGGGGLPINDRL